jgi:AraC-like DNA-binding protein
MKLKSDPRNGNPPHPFQRLAHFPQPAVARFLRAGDAFILFPDEWHRYRPHLRGGWRSWWIGLRGEYALHLMSSLFSPVNPVIPFLRPERSIAHYREITALLEEDRERHQGHVTSLAVNLIDEVQQSAKSFSQTLRQDRIGKAKMSLLARSQEEVDLEELAHELGMSYSSFRREFKAETGLPPRHYLLAIRINRAKPLLKGTRRTAAEITKTVGFSSPAYFGRYFKQITGMSPRRFREFARTSERIGYH